MYIMAGYEIKPSRWMTFDFNELWHFRELFLFMAWRDIKVKYKQTFLGFVWVVLQPLALMAIFTVLWIRVMKPAVMDIPYPLFAYSGLILWGLFSSGISGAGESMISNANIIKKVYFPRIIIPASAVITALFDFMITLFILGFLVLYYGPDISYLRFVGLFSLSTFITLAASFGTGLIVSSATIRYRDFRYVMPFFLQALFFISPVVYPLGLFGSDSLKMVLSLNPLAGALVLARASLTGNPVDWQAIIPGAVTTVLLLFSGLTLFRRNESFYSDLL
jgi:lipopolysaccharide transport system permease protein